MSPLLKKLSMLAALAKSRLLSLVQVAETASVDYPFAASDIGQLHRIARDPQAASMDAATWQGMLVDPYFAKLTGAVSIFGKQVLHQRLCDGLADGPRAALVLRLRALMAAPTHLEQLSAACRSLRHADAEIATLLLEDTLPPVPRWARHSWLLFVGVLVSLGVVSLTPFGWLGVGACLYQLIALQMSYLDKIAAWDRAMLSLQMLLRSSGLLAQLDIPVPDGFAEAGAQARKLNRRLSRSPFLALMPGLRTYRDWFVAANVRHYFKSVGIVARHRDFLRACLHRCGELEADLALARHLLATPGFCWAQAGTPDCIVLERAVHPLLEHAAPLSIALGGQGAFISGQNGIGKSTLLRTVGLNLLLARAFGFCYAGKAITPMLPLYASMQSEDSLLGGESLYIAELQRARELLALAAGPRRAVFLIDEIFRGTNHQESVAAAAAVLDVLAADNLVIVSSHNLVLASLLAHRLAPLCVARDSAGTLTVTPGVLAHTNGLALLAQRGFSGEIEAKAAAVFDWLGAYLAQPGSGGHVLGDKALLRA